MYADVGRIIEFSSIAKKQGRPLGIEKVLTEKEKKRSFNFLWRELTNFRL